MIFVNPFLRYDLRVFQKLNFRSFEMFSGYKMTWNFNCILLYFTSLANSSGWFHQLLRKRMFDMTSVVCNTNAQARMKPFEAPNVSIFLIFLGKVFTQSSSLPIFWFWKLTLSAPRKPDLFKVRTAGNRRTSFRARKLARVGIQRNVRYLDSRQWNLVFLSRVQKNICWL